MLASPEIKAIIILFSISALLLGLHAVLSAAGGAAFAVPWTPDAGDGSFILLTGTVGDVRELSGGHILAEVNGTRVFVPANAAKGVALAKGDRVQVAGTVQTYQGEKEVVVRAATDVVLI